jgi:hypothetical protein
MKPKRQQKEISITDFTPKKKWSDFKRKKEKDDLIENKFDKMDWTW